MVEARYPDELIDIGIRSIDTSEVCGGDVEDIAFVFTISIRLQEDIVDREVAIHRMDQ